MLIAILLFLAGIVCLSIGAETLVKGASNLARALHILPSIIGLTIVAYGTSLPEFLVSATAIYKGETGISIGNIIGSNIANIALVLGISAMVQPLSVHRVAIKQDLPIMIIALSLFYMFAINGYLSKLEGMFLLLGFVAYTAFTVYRAMREPSKNNLGQKGRASFLPNIFLLVVGIVCLAVGTRLVVENAVTIAQKLNISTLVIGITLVAVGTSLPELATSVVAAYRKKTDISVGNIIGSNIFNTLAIGGIVTLIRGITVEQSLIFFSLPIMILLSIVLLPVVADFRITRLEGGTIVVGYIVYICLMFIYS
ncbi:calcium/sodium antiporter [bacterium]|nr:calcium/sodium antiporter [bacterium]